MEEIWLENRKLIAEQKWEQKIDFFRDNNLFEEKTEAKKIWKEQFIIAIKNRLMDLETDPQKIGVFFSGGVDSSLIAALLKKEKVDFRCYTVGFQEDTKEPEDLVEAKKVAEKLGFKLRTKIFNLTEAEEIIKKTVKILRPVQKEDVVNIGVGAVILAAAELGLKEGITIFFGGLGSEEIFAGYERHELAKEINAECWAGLAKMWDRDLVRDFTLAQQLGFQAKTPFLDAEAIKIAMKMPSSWKIKKEIKKWVLREIAEEFLGEFAWRKKKAAQYGSCFDKAIAKLTKKKGLKYKKDYLVSL